MEANAISWVFSFETKIPSDVEQMLVPGERAVAAYQTLRDVAVFTDRRLVVRDAQGLTGKKVEVYSLPWKAVNMWSTENAGRLDLSSEVELWTRAGHIKISLGKKADVRRLDGLIAACVLGD